MSRFLFLSLLVFSLHTAARAATVIHSYDKKGNTNGILGISGISQESSWRCRNNDAILCTCPTALFHGRIAKVEYQNGSAIAESLVVETPKGGQYIFLGHGWNSDLGTASSSWVPRLLKAGEVVIVVAEQCGASGSNVIARDIFQQRMLD